jgi:hypothetical protein
VCQRVKAEH